MRYFIRDHSIDLTCTVNELYTMHERGMAIYGMTHPTGDPARVLRPYVAEKPRWHYDPVLATVEDFNCTQDDGSGVLTITVARDLRCPDGPRVTGADRNGQLSLGLGVDAAPRRR